MRSILIAADQGPSFAARLETGLALARAHRAHLTVQIDTPLNEFMAVDMFGGAIFVSEALERTRAADHALGERLDHLLARQDVPFDIVETTLDRVIALADEARFADLVIADLAAPWLGDALVRIEVPVLALPARAAPLRLDGVACVAWDGSEAANRALRATAPLLRGFARVHVVTVATEPGAAFPRSEALRYLSRHDVHAELHDVARVGSVEETLEAEARRLGAEVVVMGGYGHARWREALIGGVTRYFVDSQQFPLLLVH